MPASGALFLFAGFYRCNRLFGAYQLFEHSASSRTLVFHVVLVVEPRRVSRQGLDRVHLLVGNSPQMEANCGDSSRIAQHVFFTYQVIEITGFP